MSESPPAGSAPEPTASPPLPTALPPLPSIPVVGENPDALRWGQTIPYERFLSCIHCGLCTASCPTYLETGDENNSPRGRIYLMRSLADGRLELTDEVRRPLELCLDCRACETACPSGVPYSRLIEPFRAEIALQSPRKKKFFSGWLDQFLLHRLFPNPGWLRLSLLPARLLQRLGLDRLAERAGLLRWLPERLQRMHRLLPPPRPSKGALPTILRAYGRRRARVGLFTGCVADALFRDVHWATAEVLRHNGCEVHVPGEQVCCGAIHYHNGDPFEAVNKAKKNAEAFPANLDAVIVNVAGCGAMLKDYAHLAEEYFLGKTGAGVVRLQTQIRDISEFLMNLGPIKPLGEIPLKAAYHDACHLAHAQQIREAPRQLLAMIPGLEVLPLAESEVCCGAAGSYNLLEGEMADRLARRKCEHVQSSGAEIVVSGNAGCTLQMQSELRRTQTPIPVVHPMELLAASYQRTWPEGLQRLKPADWVDRREVHRADGRAGRIKGSLEKS